MKKSWNQLGVISLRTLAIIVVIILAIAGAVAVFFIVTEDPCNRFRNCEDTKQTERAGFDATWIQEKVTPLGGDDSPSSGDFLLSFKSFDRSDTKPRDEGEWSISFPSKLLNKVFILGIEQPDKSVCDDDPRTTSTHDCIIIEDSLRDLERRLMSLARTGGVLGRNAFAGVVMIECIECKLGIPSVT